MKVNIHHQRPHKFLSLGATLFKLTRQCLSLLGMNILFVYPFRDVDLSMFRICRGILIAILILTDDPHDKNGEFSD